LNNVIKIANTISDATSKEDWKNKRNNVPYVRDQFMNNESLRGSGKETVVHLGCDVNDSVDLRR
jgi:hypothetical protein